MPIDLVFHEDTRRVVMTVGEGTRGPDLGRLVKEAVRARPALADWDWINDLRHPVEDSSADDIPKLAEVFDPVSTRPTWTVLVSHDPGLAMWAKVMDHQFKFRRHLTASSIEAAMALLDHKRAGAG